VTARAEMVTPTVLRCKTPSNGVPGSCQLWVEDEQVCVCIILVCVSDVAPVPANLLSIFDEYYMLNLVLFLYEQAERVAK